MSELTNLVKQNINFKDYYRKHFPDKFKETGRSHAPFREDRNPSFVLYDHNGADFGDIDSNGKPQSYDVIALKMITGSCDFKTAELELAEEYGITVKKQTKPKTIVATYDYHDAEGNLLYQNVRYDPKDFNQRRPHPDKPGKWIYKLDDTPRVPFGLPELLAAPLTETIYDCEGEKDCLAMRELGFIAVSCGSTTSGPSMLEKHNGKRFFKDREVVIIADSDDQGRKVAQIKARSLAGVARTVKILELPDEDTKDAFDFINKYKRDAKNKIHALTFLAPKTNQRDEHSVEAPQITINPTAKQPPSPTGGKTKRPDRFRMLDKCFKSMDVSLFFDQTQTPWASIKINDHYENMPVHSSNFKRILRKEFYQRYFDGVGTQTIENLLDAKLGIIQHSQPVRPLCIRSCWNETRDRILIDSGRPDWAVFEIGPDGWDMIYLNNNPFKRGNKAAPFACTPDTPRGSWDDLFELCRAEDETQQTIIKMWPCLALIPDIDRPGLVVIGPHGSAKTMLGTTLKMIVDPASNIYPKRLRNDPNDMLASLAKDAVSVLDNVTHMSTEISDLLCMTITGLDDEKRALFTNGDVFNTEIRSTWILTSLNNPGKLGDFMSRVFLIEVGLLPGEKRTRKRRVVEKIRNLAGLQALVFDCLCEGIKRESEIPETDLPRLDDAFIYSLAMADALGVSRETVRKAWESNRVEQDAGVSAGEILTELVPEFLKARNGKWEGTSKELLESMSIHFSVDDQPWKKSFPKTPEHLSRRLNLIQENLANQNIKTDLRKRLKTFELTTVATTDDLDPKKDRHRCRTCKCYSVTKNFCAIMNGRPAPDECNYISEDYEQLSNILEFPEQTAASL